MKTMGMMYHQRRVASFSVCMVWLLSLLFLSQQVAFKKSWSCLVGGFGPARRCQLFPGRQTLHVAAALHRLGADPVTTRHGLGDAVVLQQRADHADGKSVTGADRVHHALHWHRGDKPLVPLGPVVGAIGPELDGHDGGALVEVEGGDIPWFLVTAQQ